MPDVEKRLAENLANVRERIADAARRSGRGPSEIKLVAVTKYVDVVTAQMLIAAGCADVGESRPQELWHKAEALPNAGVRWHLIGHLQRNKVRRTLPLTTLIHSCDSLRLLADIDRIAGELRLTADLLLELNVSGETAKHGLSLEEAPRAIEQAGGCAHVRVHGLMTMAGLGGNVDDTRRDFVQLRQLRDQLSPNVPLNVSLRELSMGMSGDFDVAIEEGATIVRVGSALFEGLDT